MSTRFPVLMTSGLILLALAACGGDSSASSSGTSTPAATATPNVTTSTGWDCFNVGIYDASLCRLPSGNLAISGVGEEIFATQEHAYPNCPESWTANDAGRLCVPPAGWQDEVQNEAATLSSAKGVEVRIGPGPVNVLPERCNPIYVFGLVLGGTATTAEWCINLGGRYAHISVPAGLLAPDYYEAFQVALSAGK